MSIYAGGLVNYTNQSTAWTRILNRNASIDLDAVYYNSGALTKLSDGFHLTINDQIPTQNLSVKDLYFGGFCTMYVDETVNCYTSITHEVYSLTCDACSWEIGIGAEFSF